MTRPAQALQIAVCISAAMRFRDDVVNGFRLTHHTDMQAQLTQAFVSRERGRLLGFVGAFKVGSNSNNLKNLIGS